MELALQRLNKAVPAAEQSWSPAVPWARTAPVSLLHTSGLAMPPGAHKSLRHLKNYKSGRFSQTCRVPLSCISRAGDGCQRGSAAPRALAQWHQQWHRTGTTGGDYGNNQGRVKSRKRQSQRNERAGRVQEQ